MKKKPTPSPYSKKGFAPVTAPRPEKSGVTGKIKHSESDLRSK